MSTLNANIPYTKCYIRNSYIGLGDGVTEGYLFGVKCIINKPLLFHFQSNFGAVFFMQPLSAFVHKENFDLLSDNEQTRLSLLQTWDCQSNFVSVTTFSFLQYKRVDIHCRDGKWRAGKYLFTIDDYHGDLNEINVGYSTDNDSKCYQFIELEDGNYCAHPNNLLRWHNPDFIVPYDKDNIPKLKINSKDFTSEDIDRSYGNSPYYFYNDTNQ
jgi:hypothetical protein